MPNPALTWITPSIPAAIVAMRGDESLGSLFAIDLELSSTTPLTAERLLGQPVRVAVSVSGKVDRYVSGICARFSEGARSGTSTTSRVTVVPSVWLLTKRAGCRIFQDQTAQEILKKVFAGFDVVLTLTGTYPKREYCVQYRESDMHFAQRLMEDEGIYFFFKHGQGGDQMVITDNASASPTLGSFAFANAGLQNVHEWERVQELRAGKVTLRDYDFEKPKLSLSGDGLATSSIAALASEIYDYPGGSRTPSDLKTRATRRVEEEQATAILTRGASASAAMFAGAKLSVSAIARNDGAYLLTSVVTSIEQRDLGKEPTVTTRFTAIPASIPFRLARRTPRPIIAGVQTAIVVGPSGAPVMGAAPGNEQRYTDKFGRLKVQFFWDREGKSDEKSSCWIRVGGLWAGVRLGRVALPAMGTEVAVAFEDGNPDRPIIMGSLYNGGSMPPEALP